LKPLAEEKGARAEIILRLGWATLRSGKLEEAEGLLLKALAAAATPGEWRTKARAEYDLALVEAKRKKNEKAEPHLRAAFELGLKLRELDPELMPVAEKIEKADLAAGKKPVKKDLTPKESSLFPVDSYGEVDPTRSKPRPPDGFTLVHF
jgi:tetratricopeptide (TPR) repeat protein